MKVITQQFEYNQNLKFSIVHNGKTLYKWNANNTDKNHEIAQELLQDYNKEVSLVKLEVEPA